MNRLLEERHLPGNLVLQLVQGDLTAETTEAIVNAANAGLQHGAGVAGALLRAAGPSLQIESDEWVRLHGPVSHEKPAWTSGGRLECRTVIHAVGPVWGQGSERETLIRCIQGALRTADQLGLGSIALPAIATGIFGFPGELAGRASLAAIVEYFQSEHSALRLVRLVLYDQPTRIAFQKVWHDHFDPES